MSDKEASVPAYDQAQANRRIAFFSGFGVLVRMLQLGIQQRPLSAYPPAYALNALGWGGFGYWYYNLEIRQKTHLFNARAAIAASREQERSRLNLGTTGSALPS